MDSDIYLRPVPPVAGDIWLYTQGADPPPQTGGYTVRVRPPARITFDITQDDEDVLITLLATFP